MTAIKSLMRLSLLEFAREKIVWIFVFFAIAMYGMSLILGALSFDERQRIMAHFGWLAIQLANVGIVLFLGSSWLQKELDRQTCLLVLARPISRTQYFLGKFLGIWTFVFVLQFLMTLFLYALLRGKVPADHFLQVFWGTFLEVSLVLAVSFFAASFVRSNISFLLGFGVFLIGHWMQEIEFFGRKFSVQIYVVLAEILHWTVPQLFQMNWRAVYFIENGVPASQMIWVTFHALAWMLFLLSVGNYIFRRKDLV